MQIFHLCAFCLGRFPKRGFLAAAGSAGCFCCGGLLSGAGSMVDRALGGAKGCEWETFAVSSSFPKKLVAREEEIADLLLPGQYTSLKNHVNAELIRAIAEKSGKSHSTRNADVTFVFNFVAGTVQALPSHVFVFGHYIKNSRQHCQSRWHCSDCRGKGCASCGGSGMNHPSVEEEIGKPLVAAFSAEGCSLHASGREDVDVRCMGNGRPFVMQLKSARKKKADLASIELALRANPAVQAVGLKLVGPHFVDAVCGSHFDKEYEATVAADRPLSDADAAAVESLSGRLILQQTPNRVLSRRADLERRRRVHRVTATAAGGKLILRIFAEAGTYIKELVSSDEGRTKPSVSELLSCKASCESLDVVSIRDSFLGTVAD